MYIKINKSITLTQREFRRVKNTKKAPSKCAILKWYAKFRNGEPTRDTRVGLAPPEGDRLDGNLFDVNNRAIFFDDTVDHESYTEVLKKSKLDQ